VSGRTTTRSWGSLLPARAQSRATRILRAPPPPPASRISQMGAQELTRVQSADGVIRFYNDGKHVARTCVYGIIR